MEIHVVQPGETLYSIAGQYGTDPLLLREANGVGPGGALAVGQALVVQIVRTFHVVQPGETLSAVARRYGSSPAIHDRSPPPSAPSVSSQDADMSPGERAWAPRGHIFGKVRL